MTPLQRAQHFAHHYSDAEVARRKAMHDAIMADLEFRVQSMKAREDEIKRLKGEAEAARLHFATMARNAQNVPMMGSLRPEEVPPPPHKAWWRRGR